MEKRQHPRVPFSGQAKIATGGRSVAVKISNMSLGGLLLHSNKPFDLGKELVIRVNGTYKGKPFEEKVNGRIVAIHRNSAGSSYGLQFGSYLDPDHQPCLSALVSKSKRKRITSFLRDTS